MITLNDLYYEHLIEGADLPKTDPNVDADKLMIASLIKERDVALQELHKSRELVEHLKYREDKHLREIEECKKQFYAEFCRANKAENEVLIKENLDVYELRHAINAYADSDISLGRLLELIKSWIAGNPVDPSTWNKL
jgi:hypothetical protein